MPAFRLVDVFAEQRYAGNQLAVVESFGDLDGEEMQQIAAEMNFSETTFVESSDPAGARVRIFTPEAEIPFAGHPTLGTAHVIREHLVDGRPDRIVLDLDVGDVPVDVRPTDGAETLWMTQQPPTFGETLDAAPLADVLSLDAAAIDADWPVQVVSTGLPTIVVPLVDREALTSIELDRAAYDRVTGERDAKLVLAFCPDPREAANDLAVRVFAPFYGVPEDPATGSANGCLAAYLARHAFFGSGDVEARVEQGYEIGRPSLVHLSALDRGGEVDVKVGGSVVDVARGELV
jgi:trans-2,3-dihydro-3-hydroxyanthranilate isomerase